MIEEVLNEATLTYKDLGKRNNKQLFFDKIKNKEPFKTKDGKEVIIDAEKSKPFLEPIINDQPPRRNTRMVTTTGKLITLSSLQKTGTVFGTGGSAAPSAGATPKIKPEAFEGNLVLALNGIISLKDPRIKKDYPKLKFNNFQEAQDVALAVVKNSGIPSGEWQKLATIKKNLTDLYRHFGVIQGVPKTDITDGSNRTSVKKEGGTILSAESGESRALLSVALGFTSLEKLQADSLLGKEIDSLAEDLSKKRWNSMTPKQRRHEGNVVLQKLLSFVETVEESAELKYNILFEAVTGNNRFITEPAKANKMLVWFKDGRGSFSNIEAWTAANNDKLRLDVRWRGTGRSGGFRIDKLSAPFKKKMQQILGDMSFYQNEELSVRQGSPSQSYKPVDTGIGNLDVQYGMIDLLQKIVLQEIGLSKVTIIYDGSNIEQSKEIDTQG